MAPTKQAAVGIRGLGKGSGDVKRLLVLPAALLVAACGGTAANPTPITHIDLGTPTAGTVASTPTVTAIVVPATAAGTTAPFTTATPAGGPLTMALGQAVDITCDGADCLEVAIDKVQFAKSYRDPDGFLNDTPKTKGDVFMAYRVAYTATGATC